MKTGNPKIIVKYTKPIYAPKLGRSIRDVESMDFVGCSMNDLQNLERISFKEIDVDAICYNLKWITERYIPTPLEDCRLGHSPSANASFRIRDNLDFIHPKGRRKEGIAVYKVSWSDHAVMNRTESPLLPVTEKKRYGAVIEYRPITVHDIDIKVPRVETMTDIYIGDVYFDVIKSWEIDYSGIPQPPQYNHTECTPRRLLYKRLFRDFRNKYPRSPAKRFACEEVVRIMQGKQSKWDKYIAELKLLKGGK